MQTAAVASHAHVPVQTPCARALQGAGTVTAVQVFAVHAQLPVHSDSKWTEAHVTKLSSH